MMSRLLVLTFSVLLFMGPVPERTHLAAAAQTDKPGTVNSNLMAAAEAGDCAAVESLIEAGSDISVRAPDGSSVLLVAAQMGCLEACRMLLDMGAQPDGRNDAGGTPMLAASSGGHVEILEELFARGADVLTTANDGATALHFASAAGDMELVRTIFELAKTESEGMGRTAEDHARVMAEYINQGDSNGWTPLMNAAWNGDAEMLRLLLGMGADPAARDKRGNTARIMAVRNNQPEAQKVLLEAEKAAPQQ